MFLETFGEYYLRNGSNDFAETRQTHWIVFKNAIGWCIFILKRKLVQSDHVFISVAFLMGGLYFPYIIRFLEKKNYWFFFHSLPKNLVKYNLAYMVFVPWKKKLCESTHKYIKLETFIGGNLNITISNEYCVYSQNIFATKKVNSMKLNWIRYTHTYPFKKKNIPKIGTRALSQI